MYLTRILDTSLGRIFKKELIEPAPLSFPPRIIQGTLGEQ
jgi:hypothetical protein